MGLKERDIIYEEGGYRGKEKEKKGKPCRGLEGEPNQKIK